MPALDRFDPGHRRGPRRWPDLYPSHRAFSLVEILLVLAIVAVVAAVAAPRYGRAAGRYRADLAAHRLVADLHLAQSCAKAASAPRTVSFSTTTAQYRLWDIPSPDGVPGDYTVVLSGAPYHADLKSADFNGSAQIVFDGWGAPASGGTVVIETGAEQRTVVIDGGTGRASIQ